jgi:acetyltransferase-like isoleucine patch superfamily enzyme
MAIISPPRVTRLNIAYAFPRQLSRLFHLAGALYGSLIGRAYLSLSGVRFYNDLKMRSLPIVSRAPGAIITIGHACDIRNRLQENLAGITHRTVLCALRPGAAIHIGNHVGISGAILHCTSRIIIDDYVSIGAGARLYDNDLHPLDADSRRTNLPEHIEGSPIHICSDVWIGTGALILKGVTVGERSIIAARSVVTHDVPPNTLVGGVPARTLRILAAADGV